MSGSENFSISNTDSPQHSFDWLEIIRTGAQAGLKPNEIWDLELWEYNNFILAGENRQKREISSAILSGYYTAYYMNGGKKAKSPNDLIKDLYSKKPVRQSFEQGLKDIERLKELERNMTQK